MNDLARKFLSDVDKTAMEKNSVPGNYVEKPPTKTKYKSRIPPEQDKRRGPNGSSAQNAQLATQARLKKLEEDKKKRAEEEEFYKQQKVNNDRKQIGLEPLPVTVANPNEPMEQKTVEEQVEEEETQKQMEEEELVDEEKPKPEKKRKLKEDTPSNNSDEDDDDDESDVEPLIFLKSKRSKKKNKKKVKKVKTPEESEEDEVEDEEKIPAKKFKTKRSSKADPDHLKELLEQQREMIINVIGKRLDSLENLEKERVEKKKKKEENKNSDIINSVKMTNAYRRQLMNF